MLWAFVFTGVHPVALVSYLLEVCHFTDRGSPILDQQVIHVGLLLGVALLAMRVLCVASDGTFGEFAQSLLRVVGLVGIESLWVLATSIRNWPTGLLETAVLGQYCDTFALLLVLWTFLLLFGSAAVFLWAIKAQQRSYAGQEDSPRRKANEEDCSGDSGSSRAFLLLEDLPDLRDQVSRLLGDRGIEVLAPERLDCGTKVCLSDSMPDLRISSDESWRLVTSGGRESTLHGPFSFSINSCRLGDLKFRSIIHEVIEGFIPEIQRGLQDIGTPGLRLTMATTSVFKDPREAKQVIGSSGDWQKSWFFPQADTPEVG